MLPSNLDFQTPGTTPGSALGWTATATCTSTGFGSYQSTPSGRRRRTETFTSSWPADVRTVAFTSNGTGVLASAGHPFTTDDADKGRTLVLTGATPGWTVPSPLKALAVLPTHGEPDLSYCYFVVNVVEGVSFGLSLTPGGSPIVVASGSGAVARPGVEFYSSRLTPEAKIAGVVDSLTDHPGTVESFNWWPDYRHTGRLGSDLFSGNYSANITNLDHGVPIETFSPPWEVVGFSVQGAPSDTLDVTYGTAPPDGTGLLLETNGTLPSPGDGAAAYFVVESAAGTFKLSATPGGAPVTWANAGTGQHTTLTIGFSPTQGRYRHHGRAPGDTAGDGNDETFALWTASLAEYRTNGRAGGGADVVAATFDNGTSSLEDFKGCIATTWVPTIGTAVCTCPVEPPSVGAGVIISVDDGGTLPPGMTAGETWFVISRNSGSKTFLLSDTKGGASHNFAFVGSGVFRIQADERYCWSATA